MLFHVEDEAGLPGWQSGLFFADGTPKSSLDAVRAAAAAARAGTLTACPDTTAPIVTMGALANGTFTVQASDDVGVGKVELYVNGVIAGTDYAAPYLFVLPPAKGQVTLLAKAYDAAGNVGRTTTVLRLRAARVARRR